jgi:uncharacterized membrane protein
MKKLFITIFVFIYLIFPRTSFADDGWIIDNFNSNISIQKTGEVLIKEKIDVDFNSLSKHGIYRDIPYVYENNNGKTYTEIDVQQILQNGQKAKFDSSLTDGYERLKIGDPDNTISGKNSYEIDYIARGVLRRFSDHDELYWNVTGNNWPVGINSTTATVTLPMDGITKLACFEGYSESIDECKSASESASLATFSNANPLTESQGMTVVVGYKKGLVPILKVERPKTLWEKFISWPSLTTLGILLLFGVGRIAYLWLKYGRDYWFGDGNLGKRNDLGKTKPIGAHETTVVEFTPPENLRPAEIGVLVDERADTLDVVSTIIDLATRGYLTITEIPKKWMFGKTDYSLRRTDKSDDDLLSYESLLLTKLFDISDEISLSSLKNTFYSDLKDVKNSLYDEVVAKGLFPSSPEKIRQKYLGMAILLIFFGGFAISFALSSEIIFLADLCIGIMFSGIILLIFSRFMPRRTAYGRELYRRIHGYRMFINTSEKYRQKFFEKKNLFNEVLPYAIVFGLTGKFANAMKDMGIKNTNPGWYSGAHPFNVVYFGSSMNSFSNSMSSAIASTPSSGGGFSGGGSSGGGFGGGGGGSW